MFGKLSARRSDSTTRRPRRTRSVAKRAAGPLAAAIAAGALISAPSAPAAVTHQSCTTVSVATVVGGLGKDRCSFRDLRDCVNWRVQGEASEWFVFDVTAQRYLAISYSSPKVGAACGVFGHTIELTTYSHGTAPVLGLLQNF